MLANTNIFQEKTFFLIYSPKSKDIKIEMLLGHNQPQDCPRGSFSLEFKEIVSHQMTNTEQKIVLYGLEANFYSKFEAEDRSIKTIKTNEGSKQVWGYQIRTNKKGRYSYEKKPKDKDREISRAKVDYIFSLNIDEKESIMPQLDQAFWFIVLLIETDRFCIEEFVSQYIKKFRPPSEDEVKRYLVQVQNYISEKNSQKFIENSDTVFALVYLLGLVPKVAGLMLDHKLINASLIIDRYGKKFIETLLSQKEQPVLWVFLKGLCYLFILEEKQELSHNWLEILQSVRFNQEVALKLAETFTSMALSEQLELEFNVLEELEKANKKLFCYSENPWIINQTKSLVDLIKVVNKTFLLIFKFEANTTGDKSPESLESKLKERSKNLKKILVAFINDWLEEKSERLIDQMNFNGIIHFLTEFEKSPHDIQKIFSKLDDVSNVILSNLKDIKLNVERLPELDRVLKSSKTSLLLPEFDISEFIAKQISDNHYETDLNLYIQIFTTFVVPLERKSFEKIFRCWFERIHNKVRVFERLDNICSKFNEENDCSPIEISKRYLVVDKLVSSLPGDSYKDKLEIFFRCSKDKANIKVLGRLVKKEIAEKDLGFLRTKNTNNPLLMFNKLLKKCPNEPLLINLISFCLKNIKINKGDLKKICYRDIFENPTKISLVYLVLNKKVFWRSEIYEDINEVCCSILKEIQEWKIDPYLIFKSDELKDQHRKIALKLLNMVVENSKLTWRNDRKLNVEELLNNYKKSIVIAFKNAFKMLVIKLALEL